MKLVKLIDPSKTYVGKDGNTYESSNFYLVLDDKTFLQIKPSFVKDYGKLEKFAEKKVKE